MFKEYVDFMRNADGLTACLMHHSLPMLQAISLNKISLASGSRAKSSTNISKNLFSRLLGLETEEELNVFCDYHGLIYDTNSSVVTLKPGGGISSDPKQCPRMRSAKVVEPKLRQKNVAELIAKKSLHEIPEPNITEIYSFDQSKFDCLLE